MSVIPGFCRHEIDVHSARFIRLLRETKMSMVILLAMLDVVMCIAPRQLESGQLLS